MIVQKRLVDSVIGLAVFEVRTQYLSSPTMAKS